MVNKSNEINKQLTENKKDNNIYVNLRRSVEQAHTCGVVESVYWVSRAIVLSIFMLC